MALMALTAGIGGGPILAIGGAELVSMTDWELANCRLQMTLGGLSAIMDDGFCSGDHRSVVTH